MRKFVRCTLIPIMATNVTPSRSAQYTVTKVKKGRVTVKSSMRTPWKKEAWKSKNDRKRKVPVTRQMGTAYS